MAFMADSTAENFEKIGIRARSTFDMIASDIGIMLFRIGIWNKAVAYASAIINTAQGVTMALSAYPPPMSFIMAALQAAAGAAEIATISSQSIPSGLEGGITAKEGIYHLHPGEWVSG